jgi:hypothetical protein
MADRQQHFFRAPDAPGQLAGRTEPTPTNRRSRFERKVPTQLRDWLIRATRVHAHICSVVRLYARPGAADPAGDSYESRAARCDQTLLFDAMRMAGDESHAIADEIYKVMESATGTDALPGTTDKVAIMRQRALRGESLFTDRDRRTPL